MSEHISTQSGGEGGSEVARIRRQVEAECEALQLVFRGYNKHASHETIQNQFSVLDGYMDRLTPLVGVEEATNIVVGAYTQIVV